MFFSSKVKALARESSESALQSKYASSEVRLLYACSRGDMKRLKREMKEHRKYEYALLCKKFKNK